MFNTLSGEKSYLTVKENNKKIVKEGEGEEAIDRIDSNRLAEKEKIHVSHSISQGSSNANFRRENLDQRNHFGWPGISRCLERSGGEASTNSILQHLNLHLSSTSTNNNAENRQFAPTIISSIQPSTSLSRSRRTISDASKTEIASKEITSSFHNMDLPPLLSYSHVSMSKSQNGHYDPVEANHMENLSPLTTPTVSECSFDVGLFDDDNEDYENNTSDDFDNIPGFEDEDERILFEDGKEDNSLSGSTYTEIDDCSNIIQLSHVHGGSLDTNLKHPPYSHSKIQQNLDLDLLTNFRNKIESDNKNKISLNNWKKESRDPFTLPHTPRNSAIVTGENVSSFPAPLLQNSFFKNHNELDTSNNETLNTYRIKEALHGHQKLNAFSPLSQINGNRNQDLSVHHFLTPNKVCGMDRIEHRKSNIYSSPSETCEPLNKKEIDQNLFNLQKEDDPHSNSHLDGEDDSSIVNYLIHNASSGEMSQSLSPLTSSNVFEYRCVEYGASSGGDDAHTKIPNSKGNSSEHTISKMYSNMLSTKHTSSNKSFPYNDCFDSYKRIHIKKNKNQNESGLLQKNVTFSSDSSYSTSSSMNNKHVFMNATVASSKNSFSLQDSYGNGEKRPSLNSHFSQQAFAGIKYSYPTRQKRRKRKHHQLSFNKQFTDMFTTKTRIDGSDEENEIIESDDICRKDKRQKHGGINNNIRNQKNRIEI